MHKYLLKLNGFERHVFVYIFGLKMGISIRCNCSFSEKKEQTLDTLTYNQSQTKASTSIRVILICDLLLHKHSKIPRLIFRMIEFVCADMFHFRNRLAGVGADCPSSVDYCYTQFWIAATRARSTTEFVYIEYKIFYSTPVVLSRYNLFMWENEYFLRLWFLKYARSTPKMG